MVGEEGEAAGRAIRKLALRGCPWYSNPFNVRGRTFILCKNIILYSPANTMFDFQEKNVVCDSELLQ